MPDFSTNYSVVKDKSIRTNYDVLEFSEVNETTLHNLLMFARNQGYSDIYIETNDQIRAKKDGYHLLITPTPLDSKSVETLAVLLLGGDRIRLGRIYEAKGINERFDLIDPQNPMVTYGYRINITGCTPKKTDSGYNISIRVINPAPFTAKDLNVPADIVNKWSNIFQGLVLIIGATGEGKTTTLASLIRHTLETPSNKRILEFSRPIEYIHHGYKHHYSNHISQCAVREGKTGGQIESYDMAVNELVRKNPDIVLFAEMTEYESVANGLKICNTGCGMASSIHANNCAAAVDRIIKLFPSKERDGLVYDFVNNLQILIAQKLLRSIDGKRVACFEYLIINKETKERLLSLEKASEISREIKQIIVESKTTYADYALYLLNTEKISYETYTDFVEGLV
ncbi:ATPase, T2SS/T4P/T4SS family [Photobacterium leiognathi]|uniref:ATPase, T2SS/T4P/T4SS family n=1 Tax=Photobacterium leiognathi TaxID=553611 RepID=UPI002981419C|nr:ATPase, T2SS/T4P/T4SS family [Photobacterium leiognathi]